MRIGGLLPELRIGVFLHGFLHSRTIYTFEWRTVQPSQSVCVIRFVNVKYSPCLLRFVNVNRSLQMYIQNMCVALAMVIVDIVRKLHGQVK